MDGRSLSFAHKIIPIVCYCQAVFLFRYHHEFGVQNFMFYMNYTGTPDLDYTANLRQVFSQLDANIIILYWSPQYKYLQTKTQILAFTHGLYLNQGMYSVL